ncbi:S8 family serine peptidase [Flavobacterium soli]|uniref:S8 family serine peptidase n=1 Tax=Flavobacterium soli TaxID=344881 RepID=UPI0003F8E852|nr:S8 family serine peptidase [Flavobacterium soli]
MKYFTLLFVLFVHWVGLAQTEEQKRLILSNTNTFALDELSKDFEQNEKAQAERIDLFLSYNPSFKKRFNGSDGALYEIKDIIDGKPVYISNQNQKAALATRTSRLHNGGSLGLDLEGQNMTIGIWDGGKVMANHVEFMNDAIPSVSRVTSPDTPAANAPTDDHGTHVGGTMVAKGVNPLAKGMAPKANLVSYSWINDEAEVVSEITNNALLISNHSYGVPVLNDAGNLNVPIWFMGCYNSDARAWDLIAVDAPYYLMVASAGNNGGDSYTGGLMAGYDKLTGEKNSKNNLVVANANPFASQINGNIISNPINTSSSQGPSDDGRIKPDIAADGTDLLSTYNTNTTSYATLTGTSMAAPNTSGTLLLLQQYYSQFADGAFMRSSTLKGLVCHTALESGPSAGPDAKFGWGLLDAEKAAVLMQNSFATEPTAVLSEIVVNQGETYTLEVNVTDAQKLQASICWLDPAGVARDNQTNSPLAALRNDLDLRIKKGTEVNLPWKLQLSNVAAAAIKGDNTVDNVERVEVNNALGTYTIEISHKGTLQGGSQPVSLIVSGFNTAVLSTPNYKFNDLSIFPNPTNDVLNFNLGDMSTIGDISIIDVSGKLITPRFDLNSKKIDVSNLQSGVYFVRFASEGKSLTKKFVKL